MTKITRLECDPALLTAQVLWYAQWSHIQVRQAQYNQYITIFSLYFEHHNCSNGNTNNNLSYGCLNFKNSFFFCYVFPWSCSFILYKPNESSVTFKLGNIARSNVHIIVYWGISAHYSPRKKPITQPDDESVCVCGIEPPNPIVFLCLIQVWSVRVMARDKAAGSWTVSHITTAVKWTAVEAIIFFCCSDDLFCVSLFPLPSACWGVRASVHQRVNICGGEIHSTTASQHIFQKLSL